MKIIECPRDAMQGLPEFIPTEVKVRYINQLLQVGFHTVDFGSFVSPKAIPQMKDTAEVLAQLDWQTSSSKLLAIVANFRGATEACRHEGITYLGFPLSISETFQLRNTNKSIAEALNEVNEIQELCTQKRKELVCYISMGFGNPYGDPYDESLVGQFIDILRTIGVRIISLADTIGAANPNQISRLFKQLVSDFPALELGVHLHSQPATAREKIEAAYRAGCKRFDSALKGFGGCPMAKDELVGNIATETLLNYLEDEGAFPSLNKAAYEQSLLIAQEVFPVR
ncbi:MAG: hydroxymethylglutaryl-CoA lyase [Cyclobacteriaceae bacterium]|jgi:hydroxymethylglutaryl-CoA lyase|nr:hydroxymethylglutaryl-CoA lyase [Cyclobacteriaceae bacterium]